MEGFESKRRVSKLSILDESPAELTPRIVTFLFLFLFLFNDLLFFFTLIATFIVCLSFFCLCFSPGEVNWFENLDLEEYWFETFLKKDEKEDNSDIYNPDNFDRLHSGHIYSMAKHCIFP